jgi:hypothetical protein
MTPANQQPVRVRLYSIFNLTRRSYVNIQTVVLTLCLLYIMAGLSAILWSGHWLPSAEPPVRGPLGGWFVLQLLIALFWVGMVVLPLGCIEAFMVLRKFAHAETLEQARRDLPATTSAPTPASQQPVATAPPPANQP